MSQAWIEILMSLAIAQYVLVAWLFIKANSAEHDPEPAKKGESDE